VTDCVIRATGWHAPDATITNAELVEVFNAYVEQFNAENATAIGAGEIAEMLPSSEEFIVKASGIQNRHVLDRDGLMDIARMRPRLPHRPIDELSVQAEFGLAAVKKALAKAGRDPKDVDGVIVASSAQQRNFPAVSVEIQNALGIEGWAYDMTMACASALFGLQQARDMIRAGSADSILIICPEIMSAINHYRRREVHFIFGDASAAILVERADIAPGGWSVLGTRLQTSFSNALRSDFGFLNHAEFEEGEKFEAFVDQDGHRVFRDVIPFASSVCERLIADTGLQPADIKRAWMHQANIRMVKAISKRALGREPSEAEAPVILDEYGNTSSSSVVMTFEMNSDDMNAGDKGIMAAFGAGYGCGTAIVEKR
jgi:beta-ketodecanoyl-[acyl-carrier-protein] synthase